MSFPMVPIGMVFDVRNGATPASGNPKYWDGEIPWVGPADLGRLEARYIEKGERNITPEGYASCGTQMVPKGAIILSIRAPIGHIAIAAKPMCFNQGCRGLVPRKVIRSDFAYWALLARRPALEASGQGTTFIELSREKLRAIRIPLPDLETQKAIADFLNRETARIDQLIERKQRLLELLDEKRTSLITAAVTGQIDPATGKPRPASASEGGSGTLARLRYFVQIGPRPKIAHLLIEDAEVTFAPMEALADGLGGLDTSLTRPVSEVASGSYNFFEEGDLLLAKVTPCFENGKKALASKLENGAGFATSEVHVIRPDTQRIDPMYLFYVLNSEEFRAAGIASMTGASGLRRVSEDGVLDFRLYIPDLKTQKAIVDFLDRETGRMDLLKEKVTKSMELLREYRAALITTAVTGQIDICGSHE